MPAPVRTIDLAGYTGDTWAQAGVQTPPPAGVQRLVATGTTVRWRIIPADVGGAPIDDASTTVDACLVVLDEDASGVDTLARTVSLVECDGSEQVTGKSLSDDVAPGQIFVCGLPSLTIAVGPNPPAFLLVFVDAGAMLLP